MDTIIDENGTGGEQNNPDSIDVYAFYRDVLVKIVPNEFITGLMELNLSGSEDIEDYAKAFRIDPALENLLIPVAMTDPEMKISGVAHAMSIIGIENIRNFALGPYYHFTMNRPEMLQEAQFLPLNQWIDFNAGIVARAIQASNIAASIGSPYIQQAFTGGLLFDWIQQIFNIPKAWFDSMWKQALRAAIAAHLITKPIAIAQKKNIFLIALVHNIGKLLLYAHDPSRYNRIISSKQFSTKGSRESEHELFDLTHTEIGALFMGHLKCLKDVEMTVDFHHYTEKLRNVDPNLYIVCCILKTAGYLAHEYAPVYSATDFQAKKISESAGKIPKGDQATKLKEFKELQLTSDEWIEIKMDFLRTLMKNQLV